MKDETPRYGDLLRRAQAELARVVADIPLPEPRMGFLDFPVEEFARYFLPSRPSEERRRDLRQYYDFWTETFARELRFLKPALRLRPETLHRVAGNTACAPASGATRWGRSHNWSGAVISAHSGMIFRNVSATWTVPTAKEPGDAAAVLSRGGLPGDEWKASVWIGLDGFRRSSLSLPQMGTTSEIKPNGVAGAYLWVQWWVRGQFFGEVEIKNFRVNPGDEISAVIEVFTGTRVSFTAVNTSRGTAVTVVWDAGVAVEEIGVGPVQLSTGDTGDRALTPVEGHHAVWCVERPSVMPTDEEIAAGIKPHQTKSYRLPDIGGGVFEKTVALMRPPGTGTNLSVERDLTAARYIRMIDPRPQARPPSVVNLTTPGLGRAKRRLRVDQKETTQPLTPNA